MDPFGANKPHAICIPYPTQGHINAMMQFANLLHSRGFLITFVHSEFNNSRLLNSGGLDGVKDLADFQFETIPDGLPPSDDRRDLSLLCDSLRKNCVGPFRDLVTKLNSSLDTPPVTCIIADGVMTFTLQVAQELGLPEALFWPMAACGFMGFFQFRELIRRGLVPLKDENYLENGFLNTKIDWISGMPDVRLKDLPSPLRTTDPNDILLTFCDEEAQNSTECSALILHTFDKLESELLVAIKSITPSLYTIGPLPLFCQQIPGKQFSSIRSSLWKEEVGCLEWLNRQKPASIVYVNFGSLAVVTTNQLNEFAWGLANSKQPFLWIVRLNVVMGHEAALPEEFMVEIKNRAMVASWCSQQEVLSHPSIAVFLTHCGWNSMVESISNGVPMICWPFFCDQQTNCHSACKRWGIGVEIDFDVKREEIEGLIKELVEGEKAMAMKKKAMEWKKSAETAIAPGGSSFVNLSRLIDEVLQGKVE